MKNQCSLLVSLVLGLNHLIWLDQCCLMVSLIQQPNPDININAGVDVSYPCNHIVGISSSVSIIRPHESRISNITDIVGLNLRPQFYHKYHSGRVFWSSSHIPHFDCCFIFQLNENSFSNKWNHFNNCGVPSRDCSSRINSSAYLSKLYAFDVIKILLVALPSSWLRR